MLREGGPLVQCAWCPKTQGDNARWWWRQRRKGCVHQPRNAHSCWRRQKLRERMERIPPRALERSLLCQHLNFQLPASRTAGEWICVVFNHPVSGSFQSSSRKPRHIPAARAYSAIPQTNDQQQGKGVNIHK